MKYWQHTNDSDWKPGSRWEHRGPDKERKSDLVGKVIEFTPPKRLVLTWSFPGDEGNKEKTSKVTIDIEQYRETALLTITHDELEPASDMLEGIMDGWPKVISSLKTLLETGKPLPVLW
jgi:uncharacterized protein YndB with AHSA1/START domain